MGRIRTIKPDFFRHEGLFDAEVETSLPLRLAFAGLWTICDKEGRFEWRPRRIKMDVLPYDELDFSHVLDALVTRGFIVHYAVGEKEYGCVPSFKQHQIINNRETESKIPPPPQAIENSSVSTPEARVNDASGTRHGLAQAEGEGEGEREEEKEVSANASTSLQSSSENLDGLYDDVLSAAGIKSGSMSQYWMPPAAIVHVNRWVTDLGLTRDQVIEVVRQRRKGFDAPPNGPKAFDFAMMSYAAALKAPPMQPSASRKQSDGYRATDPEVAMSNAEMRKKMEAFRLELERQSLAEWQTAGGGTA